jgi:hypothetical protein
MRRLGPAAGEQGRFDDIREIRVCNPLLVSGMVATLDRCDKTSPHPDPASAKGECPSEATAIRYAAGCYGWDAVCRVNDGRQQRHQGRFVDKMAACLAALSHNKIDTNIGSARRIVRARDQAD